ncbi:MAG: ATP-dependent helicase/nuclease subunit B, partial [Verrucomicrobiales bacterium]
MLISQRVLKLPERQRWADLDRLERQFLNVLQQRGLHDRESLRKQLASIPASQSDSNENIVLIGLPDPLPLTVRRLEKEISADTPVDVLVYCDQDAFDCAEAFDEWGRPGPVWSERAIAFDQFTDQVHAVVEPAQQAEIVAGLLAQSGAAATAVGLLDSSLERVLTNRLSSDQHIVYNPAGELLRDCPMIGLLQCLVDAAKNPTVAATGRLIRCPGILGAIEANWKSAQMFNAVRLLDEWDRIAAAHLPTSLRDIAQLLEHDKEWWYARRTLQSRRAPSAELKYTIKFVTGMIDEVSRGRTSQSHADLLESVLERVYGKQEIARDSDETRFFAAALAAVREAMTALSIADTWKDLPTSQCLNFALEHIADQRHFPPRAETDLPPIELQGWLELLWEEKPHILLVGCNEGIVPQSVTSHAFLP